MSRLDKAVPAITTALAIVFVAVGVFLFNQQTYKRGQCDAQHGIFLSSDEICVKPDGVIQL